MFISIDIYKFIKSAGRLDRITIQPGRTMKIIATVLGPLKKYVGEIQKLKLKYSLISILI